MKKQSAQIFEKKGLFPNKKRISPKVKKRALAIGAILDQHFPVPDAELQAEDAYTFLIAVILSAQCTDKRVNLVTPALFALAKTPTDMVALGVEKIQIAIASCGLARNKARFIWAMSQMVLDRFCGKVPSTLQELEQLPGVGHKTASVVIWKCFATPAFPVDTHIFRCARRWGLSEGKNVVSVELDLKHCFARSLWGKVHLQIILFARRFCQARGHREDLCPICSSFEKRE